MIGKGRYSKTCFQPNLDALIKRMERIDHSLLNFKGLFNCLRLVVSRKDHNKFIPRICNAILGFPQAAVNSSCHFPDCQTSVQVTVCIDDLFAKLLKASLDFVTTT